MEKLSVKFPGLTAFQLKLIALIAMTIDHIAAFGFEIPAVAEIYTPLRIIGRIAAPIFLMLCAESLGRTGSKSRYILRLYLAAVLTGLFTMVTNALLGDVVGVFAPGNIIFTFFYVALYSLLTERALCSLKSRDWARGGLWAAVMALTFLLGPVKEALRGLIDSRVWYDLLDALICPPLLVDYSLLFVVLGMCFYFFPSKKARCLVFLGFCALCYVGGLFPYLMMTRVFVLFGSVQRYMLMALPFMWLYNGLRGGGSKYFFYIYYPLHRYLISVAAALLAA